MDRPSNARVALYSHDSTGLGHVRRNLLIAQRLHEEGCDVLLVSGSPEATAMPRPPGTDLVTLPALRKFDGEYEARHLSIGLHELSAIRRDILTSTLMSFAPDLLIVDRHARGFLGELEVALTHLTTTRVVLGLRDVLDESSAVRREWHERRTAEALGSWYDEIWVYGDGRLARPLHDAGIAAPVPVVTTGYLAAERPAPAVAEPRVDDGPYALCMVGGGADGERLAAAALAAPRPADLDLVIVTGPQMAPAARGRLRDTAGDRDDVTILDYTHDPMRLLRDAAAAMVMGGYNTLCEVLTSETPVLVVPRDHPRMEQTIRARAMQRAGLLDVLDPATASGPAIGRWLSAAVRRERRPRTGVDLDGLDQLSSRANTLIARPPASTRRHEPTSPLALHTDDRDQRGSRAAV